MGSSKYSNETMDFLRVDGGQTVRTSVLNKTGISATRLIRDTPNHGLVDQHLPEDAFMIAFQMRDYRGDLWVDDKPVTMPILRQGQFSFYDYNRVWQANMRSDFDCINFHIPREALTALEEDHGTRYVETLSIAPGANVDDQVIRGLVGALVPAFSAPSQASMLFIDHVGAALCSHLVVSYGNASEVTPLHSGGLATWQLIRAQEMLESRLDGNITISELARACGLSSSYFARAFKLSTGMAPYRWLMLRRIEKAKDLMLSTSFSLSIIALSCGFTDQSHFTRTFSKAVGIAPAHWRKIVRS